MNELCPSTKETCPLPETCRLGTVPDHQMPGESQMAHSPPLHLVISSAVLPASWDIGFMDLITLCFFLYVVSLFDLRASVGLPAAAAGKQHDTMEVACTGIGVCVPSHLCCLLACVFGLKSSVQSSTSSF